MKIRKGMSKNRKRMSLPEQNCTANEPRARFRKRNIILFTNCRPEQLGNVEGCQSGLILCGTHTFHWTLAKRLCIVPRKVFSTSSWSIGRDPGQQKLLWWRLSDATRHIHPWDMGKRIERSECPHIVQRSRWGTRSESWLPSVGLGRFYPWRRASHLWLAALGLLFSVSQEMLYKLTHQPWEVPSLFIDVKNYQS